jgi:RNA polymerase subunit RPABC4/transcription elongation factor Spt4
MRYCYNCNRITNGEPLFCQFCGRSYSVKLCPRLHKNPRNAQICSQCGSRELSTPAPKAPLWIAAAAYLATVIPGILLVLISILFLGALIHQLLTNPRILLGFAFLALALTVLWAMWTKLPLAVRQFIRRMILDRENERKP